MNISDDKIALQNEKKKTGNDLFVLDLSPLLIQKIYMKKNISRII